MIFKRMNRGRVAINGFIPNVKGEQPHLGKDGKISNQKGAFGQSHFPIIDKPQEITPSGVVTL